MDPPRYRPVVPTPEQHPADLDLPGGDAFTDVTSVFVDAARGEPFCDITRLRMLNGDRCMAGER
jgi:hypothetical protein